MSVSRVGFNSSPTCPLRQGGKMIWLSAIKGGTNERLQTQGNNRYQKYACN